ncbi:iron permease [Ramlibacter sp. G-1-2-2]|uniref:Iron permease n=1 Tax=Ramlibacter agri TaxID=2728837 RepID=A0A848H2U8_9BURK|nr:FTR1 family protein [Ramlibacter agri]NML43839.1 iron permease [Ramlibacter agri]
MFAAALIVFRESLEAALFVGIVAAATRGLAGRNRWLGGGVGIGVLGALVLALAAQHVGEWFDGLGQDVINIAVLSVALAMLLWHCIWVAAHAREMAAEARLLGQSVQHGNRRPWALLIAVALAVLREGAETVLFVGGALTGTQYGTSSIVGAVLLGMTLGVGAGVLVYTGLARIPARHLFAVTNVLIAILAGAIGSQLVKTLAQAGFIERWTAPLWDSSHLLAQDSALGTLLHALVGYDAQPSGAQLASYVAVLALIYVGNRMMRPASRVAGVR